MQIGEGVRLQFLGTLKNKDEAGEVATSDDMAFIRSSACDGMTMLAFKQSAHNPREWFHSGNVEPTRGFGHIAVFVDDVYATCDALAAKGIRFQKTPDGGRMKGLAFALDNNPTDPAVDEEKRGYWIEIIKRGEDAPEYGSNLVNLSQTMIRVKDPAVSLPFYAQLLGMELVAEKHFEDAAFSLFFLAQMDEQEKAIMAEVDDPASDEAFAAMKKLWSPVLELTWNHGTESDADFSYNPGESGAYGFGQTSFIVDDLEAAAAQFEALGTPVTRIDGIDWLVFLTDPDGYSVELLQRAE